jgi:peroxisomal enoyl-CoA hydratase 2
VVDAHVTFRERAGYSPGVPDTPSFEDLSVGDEAPPLVVENVSRTNFVRYAGASGDFNPMHHDDTVATSVGNPSVFGHGMLTAGLMARVVKDWFGPEALRHLQVRFSRQVWPGETLTCKATVTALREDDGVDLADLELRVENEEGEPKLTGSATAAVPKAS